MASPYQETTAHIQSWRTSASKPAETTDATTQSLDQLMVEFFKFISKEGIQKKRT